MDVVIHLGGDTGPAGAAVRGDCVYYYKGDVLTILDVSQPGSPRLIERRNQYVSDFRVHGNLAT